MAARAMVDQLADQLIAANLMQIPPPLQILGKRAPVRSLTPACIFRWLWLYGRISDQPHVYRCPRAAHLRRFERNYAYAGCPRALSGQVLFGVLRGNRYAIYLCTSCEARAPLYFCRCFCRSRFKPEARLARRGSCGRGCYRSDARGRCRNYARRPPEVRRRLHWSPAQSQ